jgi:NAD+ synthase
MQEKFKVGALAGKFLPPQMGHAQLIADAAKQCEVLYVVVSDNPQRSAEICRKSNLAPISHELRIKWLKEFFKSHKNIKFVHLDETGLPPFPDGTAEWSKRFKALIGRPVDAKFFGEDTYRKLNEEHFPESKVVVTRRGKDSPDVCATQIRENPRDNLKHLIPPAREYFEGIVKGRDWEVDRIVAFIKRQCNPFAGVAIGISGGKDSSAVAALCVKALGADKVLGVMMPNGTQSDISDSRDLIAHLGISSVEVNIKDAVDAIIKQTKPSETARMNVAPRVRMTTLYAIAQSHGKLVTCNSNLSERTIGYTTKFGDGVGDFAPLAHLTCSQVLELARHLGLPKHLAEKTPADGLSGKTDEDALGFTYHALDTYIMTGQGDAEVVEKIEKRIRANWHKTQMIPTVT